MTAKETSRNSNSWLEVKEFVLAVGAKISEDNLPRLASSFSFFALLSMAPFLVLAVTVGSLVLSHNETASRLLAEAAHVGGPQVKDYLSAIIQSSQHRASGIVATVLSIVVTFYGASGLFLNLDDAINWIWKKKSTETFIKSLIVTRIVAFVSVFLFGSILLGWVIVDSTLGYFARQQSHIIGWEFVSYGVSVLFFTGGFTFTLHALPRDHLTLRDALPGGFITALVFSTSKFLLTYYFAGAFGVYKAAGGVVILLLWMYYSTMIYFLGVEITYVYSHRFGSRKEMNDDTLVNLSKRDLPAS